MDIQVFIVGHNPDEAIEGGSPVFFTEEEANNEMARLNTGKHTKFRVFRAVTTLGGDEFTQVQ